MHRGVAGTARVAMLLDKLGEVHFIIHVVIIHHCVSVGVPPHHGLRYAPCMELTYPDTWLDLERSPHPMTSKIVMDEVTTQLVGDFDYQTDGVSQFYPYLLPADLPEDFSLGVIVGASGTGKSTLLDCFNQVHEPQWSRGQSISSHFASVEDARERLYAVGLTSVPTWVKPYNVLSTGEKFRADLARQIGDGAVIDEYTSVVDRNIALASSASLARYIQTTGVKRLVLATCHRDVLPYLQPDWVIDTDAGAWALHPRGCLHREPMVAQVFEVTGALWEYFKGHHYLSGDISPFARSWCAVIGGQPVAFYSVLSYPSGTVTDAFRGHRLVTHPDWQGLGIAPRLADWVASLYVSNGKRFFAKTAHPRLGEYRERSPLWKPTSKNRMVRTDATGRVHKGRFASWVVNPVRMTYSHEFVGDGSDRSTALLS